MSRAARDERRPRDYGSRSGRTDAIPGARALDVHAGLLVRQSGRIAVPLPRPRKRRSFSAVRGAHRGAPRITTAQVAVIHPGGHAHALRDELAAVSTAYG